MPLAVNALPAPASDGLAALGSNVNGRTADIAKSLVANMAVAASATVRILFIGPSFENVPLLASGLGDPTDTSVNEHQRAGGVERPSREPASCSPPFCVCCAAWWAYRRSQRDEAALNNLEDSLKRCESVQLQ